MITRERAEILTNFLNSDHGRAKELLMLEPIEALARINDFGYDFTLDEIKAYGKTLDAESSHEMGEMDIDALDAVAGGAVDTVYKTVVRAISGYVKKW
jgi:hypothetical protein